MTGELIIGGGPIGLYLGSKTREATIIEQKKQVGSKIACSGLVSQEIKKHVKKKIIEESKINTIKETIVKGPRSETTIKTGTNYIFDNKTFEEKLYDEAIKHNEIKLGKKYLRSEKRKHHIKDIVTGKIIKINKDKILGIDGPQSKVAEQNGLSKRKNYMGYQVLIKIKKPIENKIIFYPHIKEYAWVIPEDPNTIRLGLTSKIGEGKKEFEWLKKQYPGRIIKNISGLIPKHEIFNKTHNEKAILIGDSAGHIKNTTGGGIIPGFKAVDNYLKHKEKYHESWKLQKELATHNLVHNLLRKNSEKDWEKIIQTAKKHEKEINEISRDELNKLFWKMIKEPEFVKIGLKNMLKILMK